MFFTALFLITGLAKANSPKIEGRIKSVDLTKSALTISDIDNEDFTFAIVPSTEIEFKDKVIENGKIEDLKIGQWVRVEYTQGKKTKTAQEVKIYKEKR